MKDNNKSQLKIIEILSLENERSIKKRAAQNEDTVWKSQSRNKGNQFNFADKNRFTIDTNNPFNVLEHRNPSPIVDWYKDTTSNTISGRKNNNDTIKRRPNICTTEDYIKNYELPIRTVPGTKDSYAQAQKDVMSDV